MTPKSLNTLFFLLFSSFFSHSINANESHYNQISFSVTAQIPIKNDQLIITMISKAKGWDLNALANNVNKKMAWALNKANTITNIQISTLNYHTQKTYSKGKQDGWEISQSLVISGHETAKINKLAGKLQSKLQIQSALFSISPNKRKQAQEALTTQVLQLFTEKSKKITRALQASDYKIIKISLNATPPPSTRPMMSLSRDFIASDAPPVFQAGNQQISVTATGIIEINLAK